MEEYEIWHYLTRSGQDVFDEWLESLKDDRAAARVAARITRLAIGNFGDCKPLRAGVWELRIKSGPGYRIYYARAEKKIILLLCGGDKRTQDADIQRAVEYWEDYQERSEEP